MAVLSKRGRNLIKLGIEESRTNEKILLIKKLEKNKVDRLKRHIR
jgi:hypothetical protein